MKLCEVLGAGMAYLLSQESTEDMKVMVDSLMLEQYQAIGKTSRCGTVERHDAWELKRPLNAQVRV